MQSTVTRRPPLFVEHGGNTLEVVELDSIVGSLSRKYPLYTDAEVRDVVYATYRRLAGAARITTHLIPLTVNLSQGYLARTR